VFGAVQAVRSRPSSHPSFNEIVWISLSGKNTAPREERLSMEVEERRNTDKDAITNGYAAAYQAPTVT